MNIRDWISASCSKSGFADVHIDHFDVKWKDRVRWIEGGVSVLQEAVAARSLANCDYKLAIVYSLQTSTDTLGITFTTAKEFHNELDHSPPSLFIAESGSEPWVTSQASQDVQIAPLSKATVKRIFPVVFECQGLLMRYCPNEKQESSLTAWFLP